MLFFLSEHAFKPQQQQDTHSFYHPWLSVDVECLLPVSATMIERTRARMTETTTITVTDTPCRLTVKFISYWSIMQFIIGNVFKMYDHMFIQ